MILFNFFFPFVFCLLCFYSGNSLSLPVAKSIHYEVRGGGSREFFVADGALATLFYQYNGSNSVRSFSWRILPTDVLVARISSVGSNALPPYSVTGNLREKRTSLTISSVNASLNGNVYQCIVTLSSFVVQLSGLANLTLKDLPVLSAIPSSSQRVIVPIGKSFLIRINVTQGNAVVNLTKDGELTQLKSRGKLYEHNITKMSNTANGTYIAIGENDVGYHTVKFQLLAFYLGDAECRAADDSIVNVAVTCTIRSVPPVETGTYSCGNRSINLSWREMESADTLGVRQYQAKALVSNMGVPRRTGTLCVLIAANEYGQLIVNLKEVLPSTPTPSIPTTNRFKVTSTSLSSDTVKTRSMFSPTRGVQPDAETCRRTGLIATIGVLTVLIVAVGSLAISVLLILLRTQKQKNEERVQRKTESVEMHSSSLYASAKDSRHQMHAKTETPEYASISEAKN
ncbi:uncharacterized protein [Oscarella lobularis]|uniref:uncharacterized protein isoform X2 n=1 Tax=Oscarella lobularis TaxID=121494 RepID=UPI0033132D02